MGRVCREFHERVEEEIEKPIEDWEERTEEQCRRQKCNWWTLCLNKLTCWVAVIVVKVVRIIIVTVGKWVTRVVCEFSNLILDLVGFFIGLILSIPIIGGVIRTILNWATEIGSRVAGIIDFFGSLLGIRLRKKMYVGLVIPRKNGAPITNEAALLPQIQSLQQLFDNLCNINVIYTGACESDTEAPSEALTVSCDASGFFSDWWIAGSYFEFASALCRREDSWRRVIGYGAEILVFPIINVTTGANSFTDGCSMGPTHNYVVVEPTAGQFVTAHEVGHACGLLHRSDGSNLMFTSAPAAAPTLTNWQIAVIRWSRHCVYI